MKKKDKNIEIDQQDSYIITLETTIEMLKRDLIKLQTNSADNSAGNYDNSNNKKDWFELYFNLINDLQAENNETNQYNIISDFLYKYYEFYEFNFYLLDDTLIVPIFNIEESNLEFKVENMIEQGIIDWIFDNKITRIIPDLFEDNSNKTTFLALVPITLENENIGFLISKVDNQISNYSNKELSVLHNICLYFLLRLNTSYKNKEIQRLKKEVEAFSHRIIETANSSTVSEISNLFINEINLPIKKLEGHIKLLKSGLGNIDRRRELIEVETNNIKDLVKQFQNITKDIKKTNVKQVEINLALSEIVRLIRQQFLQDDIEIEFQPYPRDLFVNIDKLQLEQVLLSVLKMSRAKMVDGGKIQIITNNVGRYYNNITIIDDSNGFDKDELKNIFNPNYNLKNEKPSNKNSNSIKNNEEDQSLFIAKSILQNFKAKITVVSELGIGTTYKIQIPKKVRLNNY